MAQKKFIPKMKLTLKDLFLQKWNNGVANSPKCFYYKHFHARPMLKKYLKILPKSSWIPIIKFGAANQRLPIEIYSWQITSTMTEIKGFVQCATLGK